MKHYKGAQLFTVRGLHGNPEGLDRVLGKIKAIGYDAVNGWLMYPEMNYSMYKEMLDRHGLKECSVAGGEVGDIIGNESLANRP